MTNSIRNTEPDSDIFLLGGGKNKVLVYPYKQIKKREESGALNFFQRASLTEQQKDKVEEDKKRLGGK